VPPLRTFVYIDGFNLYYRALRGTAYKWLDLNLAMSMVLGPTHSIERVKYFTARINGKFDPDAPTRQDAYLRALRAHTPNLDIVFGHFLAHPKSMPLASDLTKYVWVLRTEEKGSDVNLAVHLVNDAWQGRFDAAFVVSNDSDLAEAMSVVRKLGKKAGLVVPGDSTRAAVQLARIANPVLRLRAGVLAKAQLPDPIPNTTIRKPGTW
jgi:uncharacterized LabA/DUF88 family protein